MTVTPTNVIQSNEYYAFGMQASNSWTRDNAVGNNFLANSGTELNITSSLYDLDFRNYDPVLGRMNGVDMMTDRFSSVSPYNFSFNNPVLMSDPSGAIPCTLCQNGNGGEPTPNVIDGGTINGQGPIRDMYGNSVWLGNSVSYDMYSNAINGYGSTDGYSIYGRPLSTYYQNSEGQYGVWIDYDQTGSRVRRTGDNGDSFNEGRQLDDEQISAPKSRFVSFSSNSGDGGSWVYDIPGVGSAKRAANEFDNGNYFQAAGWEAWGVFELVGIAAIYKAVAVQGSKFLANVAATTGGKYAFGLKNEVVSFADEIGASHLMKDPNWKSSFANIISNSENELHFTLNGIDQTPMQMILNPGRSGINWEMNALYSNNSAFENTIFHYGGNTYQGFGVFAIKP